MTKHIGSRFRKKINMLQSYDSKRWHKWWSEGKKDGLSSVYMDLRSIPKLYRHAYRTGFMYGEMCREAGHDPDCTLKALS